MSANLFDSTDEQGDASSADAPLAERMRPDTLDGFVGQRDIIGEGTLLRRLIESDQLSSVILWGPPGTGKTTLARIIANHTGAKFESFSAVTSGIKEVRLIVDRARQSRLMAGRRTILFVDEIHRFNKAQQDAFLPHVEDGTVVLVGATTENPSFEVNSALLSRSRVFILERLQQSDLAAIITSAAKDSEQGLHLNGVTINPDAVETLAERSDGDARVALNALEASAAALADGANEITPELVMEALQKTPLLYDRDGEEHYNTISALHKAVRGSDPDAALYWLARMLVGGEEPMYLARRLIRMASEDIGLADPQALPIAIAARDAYQMLGSPEGELALAELAVYLATAPKSNSTYFAFKQAMAAAKEYGSLPVPLHIRNAPTSLMKDLGYGKGYQYDPSAEDGVAAQTYLPDELSDQKFYEPGRFGFEKTITERLQWWARKKSEARAEGADDVSQ